MGLDSVQTIKQTIRLLPALAREVEGNLTLEESVEFNSLMNGIGTAPVSGKPTVSQYQQEFVQHVVTTYSNQIDEADAHCNKIYSQCLEIAKDEEFGDVYHREQIEDALKKSGCSVQEFLAVDLAIGGSFFAKTFKLLKSIDDSGTLTKEHIHSIGKIHSEASVLGEEVLDKVSGGEVTKDDLLDIIGNVAVGVYGKDGLSATKQEREQLKEIFKKYAVIYQGMLINLTKDMHYE